MHYRDQEREKELRKEERVVPSRVKLREGRMHYTLSSPHITAQGNS
jgi:hypothetical protein